MQKAATDLTNQNCAFNFSKKFIERNNFFKKNHLYYCIIKGESRRDEGSSRFEQGAGGTVEIFVYCSKTPIGTSRERPKSAPYLRLKKTRKPLFLQLETTKALKKLKIEKKNSEFFLNFFSKSHSAENVKGGRFFSC